MLRFAAFSGLLALIAIATGDLMFGFVALVSVVWLSAMAYFSSAARSSFDATLIWTQWIRASREVVWESVEEIEIVRPRADGGLKAVIVRGADGTTLRWAPWFPFLWYERWRLEESLIELAKCAEEKQVPISGAVVVRRYRTR